MDDLSTAVPAGLVEITTWSARKRHYADVGFPTGQHADGYGNGYRDALCNTDLNATRGTDQAATDAERTRFDMPLIVVADLPLCKRCERKAQQRQETP